MNSVPYIVVTGQSWNDPGCISPLYDASQANRVHEASSELYVHSNLDYEFRIVWPDLVSRYGKFSRLYVNDECFKSTDAGVEVYEKSTDSIVIRIRKPFHQHFGYVRLRFFFECENQSISRWSEYFEIFIPDDENAENLQKMSHYVYANQRELIATDELSRTSLKVYFGGELGDLNTQLMLLEKILGVYRKNLPFFQTGPKFKLDTYQVPGPIEKMRQFSAEAAQYILTHPDKLSSSPFGVIEHQGQRYMPQRTLIDAQRKNTDIYENRYIGNFLKYLYDSLQSLVSEIDDLPFAASFQEHEGYVSSAKALTGSLLESCRQQKVRMQALQLEIQQLYHAYRSCLNTQVMSVSAAPLATFVFMNVQAYREIFDLAVAWFEQNENGLKNTAFTLSLLRKSELYEHYILLKIIEKLRAPENTQLLKGYYQDYSSHTNAQHRSPFNNVFIFQHDAITMTLFFQPLIPGVDFSEDNPLGLLRNSTLPLTGESSTQSAYFTPDYIIKIDEPNAPSQYVIADAKYSYMSTVIRDQFYELVFKYLYAITTARPEDKIVGLDIYCGLIDSNLPNVQETLDILKLMNRTDDKPPVKFYQLT